MRTHRVFPALQPWLWREDLMRELVTADRLVAARVEPVTRGREPSAFVDLHFSDGERTVAVPLVYVDLAQLDVRELDPLVFPQGLLGVISDDQASAVVERLFPDLERRAMSGGFWAEETIEYGPNTLARAREREFFGAAPLAVTLPRIAAAVYARRFTAAKHVVAYGPRAFEFAGFIQPGTIACAVAGEDAEAEAWYGSFEPVKADWTYDLAIGSGPLPAAASVVVHVDGETGGERIPVVTPVPADVMLSFDESDGPAVTHFSVTTGREPFRRKEADIAVQAAGGSAGRIGIVVRPDARSAPDSDTSEAAALARVLTREGFTVDVFDGVDALEAFAPDLVHLFGVAPGAYARRVAEWAADRRKPLAVHAFYESPAAGGYWGAMVAPYCYGYAADDRSVTAFLDMLSRRAVEVDGVVAGVPFAPPIVGQTDSERVLAMADVVLVNSERERQVVEAHRPRRPTFVVPALAAVEGEPESIAARVGVDAFVLVHAPIAPESNQLMVARAAFEVGVPVVIAGPIADPSYAERLREFAPPGVMLMGEPSPATVAALYRSAAVVADVAWITRGHSRLVTAAAFGAGLVCSQTRWVDLPHISQWIVDPADSAAVARGIGEAWDAALRGDARIQATARFARERVENAGPAIVATYAKIVQAI